LYFDGCWVWAYLRDEPARARWPASSQNWLRAGPYMTYAHTAYVATAVARRRAISFRDGAVFT